MAVQPRTRHARTPQAPRVSVRRTPALAQGACSRTAVSRSCAASATGGRRFGPARSPALRFAAHAIQRACVGAQVPAASSRVVRRSCADGRDAGAYTTLHGCSQSSFCCAPSVLSLRAEMGVYRVPRPPRRVGLHVAVRARPAAEEEGRSHATLKLHSSLPAGHVRANIFQRCAARISRGRPAVVRQVVAGHVGQ
jgi:hypothetical protein